MMIRGSSFKTNSSLDTYNGVTHAYLYLWRMRYELSKITIFLAGLSVLPFTPTNSPFQIVA
jgi:GTP cyclohydrolase III